jgi:glycosyltransferase involved in cell wall biosynthesis
MQHSKKLTNWVENKLGDKSMDTNIGLITAPTGKSGVKPVANYLAIISKLSDPYIITGGGAKTLFENYGGISSNGRVFFVDYPYESNILLKAVHYISGQLRYSYYVLRLNRDVDIWMFFFGGDRMILPMIAARFLKKPVVLCVPGSAVISGRFSGDGPLILKIAEILSKIVYHITTNIILYSSNHIAEWDLEPYRHKIRIAHEHSLDFNTFTPTTPLSARPPLVGYIGRLSEEKGVQHFAQALPDILNGREDLRAFIGGDGPLRESIEASLQEGGVTACVDFPGWISHDDLPKYLNQLRLLILPSYTEGLPNIMLEAMACGTPVLATPVGAIPDVIIDGKTGFIMENNSPECIAENVIRALNSPDLEQIAEDGRRFVEENFTFERVVDRWKGVLEEI